MADATFAAAAASTTRTQHSLIDAALLVAALLAIWQALHWLAGDIAVTAPWPTLAHLADMLGSPAFWPHARETLAAFAQALALSLVGGLVLGVALGGSRLAGEVAEPILVAIYSLPKITLYPVILLMFGLGMQAKVAFGVIHGIIPVTIFAMNAVRNVRPVFLRAGQAMRLSPWQRARHILIPATIPEIVTGFRIGFALTMLGVLIGELFASQRGLGFLLLKAMERNDVPTILALAVLLFAFATVVSLWLLWLDKRLHRRV